RAGKASLVYGYLSQKIQPARTDIANFDDHVVRNLRLYADVELLHIRSAHVAIKCKAAKRHPRNEHRKSMLRHDCGKRAIESSRRRGCQIRKIERRREETIVRTRERSA